MIEVAFGSRVAERRYCFGSEVLEFIEFLAEFAFLLRRQSLEFIEKGCDGSLLAEVAYAQLLRFLRGSGFQGRDFGPQTLYFYNLPGLLSKISANLQRISRILLIFVEICALSPGSDAY